MAHEWLFKLPENIIIQYQSRVNIVFVFLQNAAALDLAGQICGTAQVYTSGNSVVNCDAVLPSMMGEAPPALSRTMALSLGLKSASVLLRMNSTTTDWMRTSMKAAVPLKQADSICLDLENSLTCPNSLQRTTGM